MRELNEHHSFVGMQRDLVCSKHPVNFLYDARNIRLTTRGESTHLAITNERGTKLALSVSGMYVGHACISQYLVLFASSNGGNQDSIYRIDLTTMSYETLYKGRLNFNTKHPITTLPFYENENIQKVYWVDGLNQPRVINIVSDDIRANIDTQFDFVRELSLQEDVYIIRNETGGYFPSGVIQYAFTYVNKYAQESNIFYISPLFYVSPSNRGAAPDESVYCSFTASIKNVDLNFSSIRMYSIERTSLDGTAITKLVRTLEYKVQYENTVILNTTAIPYSRYYGDDVIKVRETGIFDGVQQDYYKIYKINNPDLVIRTSSDYLTWGPTSNDNSYVKVSINASFNPVTGYRFVIEPREKMYLTDFNPFSGLVMTDTGTIGGAIDPTELLYKGVNNLVVGSITQKDNTLFLGNLKLESNCFITDALRQRVKSITSIQDTTESITVTNTGYGTHFSGHSINRNRHTGVDYSGFKHGETYRLGVQLQYKNGAWTDPVFIKDAVETKRPSTYSIPTFKGTIHSGKANQLIDAGFRKIRAVVVFPKENERTVLFQCVSSPTVTQDNKLIQSSWYFRHYGSLNSLFNDRYLPNLSIGEYKPFSHPTAGIEIEASLEEPFKVSRVYQTLHSPDIEFDDSTADIYKNIKCLYVGRALVSSNYSTINIQTSSGTINPDASGGKNESITDYNGRGLGIGQYIDYLVDDPNGDTLESYTRQTVPSIFDVFLWSKTGSLNNDTTREPGKGVQSAVLKKKVFSNRRFYETKYLSNANSEITNSSYSINTSLQLFNSDQINVVKIDDVIYQGNIDTVLSPKENTGKYFSNSNYYYIGNYDSRKGVWILRNNGWNLDDGDIGDFNSGITGNRNIVRMKYKTTPHLVGKLKEWFYISGDSRNSLPIIDVINNSINANTRFGGNTEKDLLNNQWLPCGEPVALKKDAETIFKYSYGDTYFGHWDCLKTYAFTPEDENQCVEIGCFQLESRINPCGRYDRNVDQRDNTMMSPVNFNLMNMVYSQKDNFFTYRIIDKDYYKNSEYPNQITWSKEKQAASEVDEWTKIPLTNTYDMDGTKGKINHLTTFKDQIFCFQDKAVSNIMFNSRVQIPASDGVPIEISNNYKVDGSRILSDGVGCNSSLLVSQTSINLYFIDSITNHLFSIGEGLQDLSTSHYMSSWFVNNNIDRLLYDNINHDLYVVNKDEALCYSELLGQFTSFFDYGGIELIESYDGRVFTLTEGTTQGNRMLWYMFEGEYNSFFEYEWSPAPNVVLNTGSRKPWYLTFVSNGSDSNMVDFDKIFTNIDYRMDLSDIEEGEFKHAAHLTFDYMQITDEYQDTGVVPVKRLMNMNARHWWNSYHHKEANTQKKFRIWRIQIPRALTWKTDRVTGERKQVFSNDRIRNPWCKITLGNYGKENVKALLHDLNVQYYI